MEPPSSTTRRRLLLGAILALALALRLAHWWAVRDQPFFARLVLDSQEYDRWAREIAAGDWRGSEVFFQAPLYPYLLAALYRLLGASLDAVYLVQISLAVAGCWALYRAGRAMAGPGEAGERAGLAAACLAAIYGPFLFYDVQLLKESLAVTVASFLLWALVAAREHPLARRWLVAGQWLGAGLLLGVLALLRENALLVAPFLLPLAWPRSGPGTESSPVAPHPSRTFARNGGALLLGLALALTPVALRNAAVGGVFLPTTFQGGTNFYIGNNAEADGTYRPIVPGKQIPALERREPTRLAEEALGRPLSPREVSAYWLHRGLAWAAANPGPFLRLQLRKLGMFWSWYEWPDAVDYYYVQTQSPILRQPLLEFGGASLLAALGLLLIRRHLNSYAPALLFLLGWTASTVLFFLFSRYRLPVVPALLLLAALPLAEIPSAWHRHENRRAYSLALACVLALVLPRVAGYQPRTDLVHYNLGRLDQEAGNVAGAVDHYRQALAANPDDFLTWLNLGNLAARSGDYQAALVAYTRAATLEPRSDDAQSNLGGANLALKRLPEARDHLDQALKLNPDNLSALQNRSLLALREGDRKKAQELNAHELALDPKSQAGQRLHRRLQTQAPAL